MAQYHSVIAKLRDATERRKIRWLPVKEENSYTCTLDDYFFIVTQSSTTQATVFAFKMFDSAGHELLSAVSRKYITMTQGDPDYQLLRDLHEIARRSAYDVDRKVDDVLKKLESM